MPNNATFDGWNRSRWDDPAFVEGVLYDLRVAFGDAPPDSRKG